MKAVEELWKLCGRKNAVASFSRDLALQRKRIASHIEQSREQDTGPLQALRWCSRFYTASYDAESNISCVYRPTETLTPRYSDAISILAAGGPTVVKVINVSSASRD